MDSITFYPYYFLQKIDTSRGERFIKLEIANNSFICEGRIYIYIYIHTILYVYINI